MQRIPQVFPGWQADELIGQGAYGKVYRASRTAGGHTSEAAIKVIDIPRDESEVASLRSMGMDAMSIRSYFEETAQSVVREVAVMDSLKGAPNVVAIEDYQLLEHDDGVGWSIFIRMELLEDLATHQARSGVPSAREGARIGTDVCRALAHCHAAGVIHRDVKPENVFVSKFGEYKLGDFGLSRRLDEGSRSTKSVAGTSDYMAPEVETGHYDETVDVYSLGVMLYRWLNGGRPPFVGASETPTRTMLEEARQRRLAGERPPLPSGAGVDPALARIVRKAVEPDPADRWRTATAFGSALQSWLDGRPVEVVEPRKPTSARVSSDSSYKPLDALGGVTAAREAAEQEAARQAAVRKAREAAEQEERQRVAAAEAARRAAAEKAAKETAGEAAKEGADDPASSEELGAMAIIAVILSVVCAALCLYEGYRTGGELVWTIVGALFTGGVIYAASIFALGILSGTDKTIVKVLAIMGGCGLTASCVPGDYAKVASGYVDWGYATLATEVIGFFFVGVALAGFVASCIADTSKED